MTQTDGTTTLAAEKAPPTAPSEQRVSQLTGDRMCARCAFNLSGQTIVREPHYGLLMVRCPECGTVAALQEYPLLGRWGTRLGYAAAGAWMGAMVLLTILSASAVWGAGNSLLAKLAAPFTERLTGIWTAHSAEVQKKAVAAGTATPAAPWSYNAADEKEWWLTLDKKAVFADGGGWQGAIDWSGLWDLVSIAFFMVALGAVMATCAPHARTRGRLLIGLLVVGLGGVFAVMDWLSPAANGAYGWYGGYYTGLSAQAMLAPYLLPPCLGVSGGFYLIGMWYGRLLARGLVRVLLPPRLRGPLAFLWIADGKPIPR